MIKNKKSNSIIELFIHLIFTVFSLLCILPIISIISVSLSKESDILNFGYKLFPVNICTAAYKLIFRNPKTISNAYQISFTMTIVGSLLSLLIIALVAYSLSRPDFKYRNKISFIVMFTMLFNGGMVPSYILISKYLNMNDTIWVLIVPYLVNAWFVLLLRTFFQKIPLSLIESAKIDGSREIKTFFSIILPLSKPGLATVGLFIALQYWNDWYLGMMFISEQKLIPLQNMLNRMMTNLNFISLNMNKMPTGLDLSTLPNESARMAMCILAAGPMLFVFPFFQKYFVKGLTVGAVKG